MNVIYLDTLFFTNCITDYFTLLCAGKLSGAVLRRPRLLGAGVLGGLYACGCVLDGMAWLGEPAVKICVGILLCLLSFGSEPRLGRCCVVFFLVSAALGGLLSAFAYTQEGLFYLPINGKALILTFALAYFLLSLLFRQGPAVGRQTLHTVTVTMGDHTVTMTALEDTGNELLDPISNAGIMVCQCPQLQPLVPECPLSYKDPLSMYEALAKLPGFQGRLRLIPCQTISGSGLLVGFRPDAVIVDDAPVPLIVALTERTFTQDNTYQAIF